MSITKIANLTHRSGQLAACAGAIVLNLVIQLSWENFSILIFHVGALRSFPFPLLFQGFILGEGGGGGEDGGSFTRKMPSFPTLPPKRKERKKKRGKGEGGRSWERQEQEIEEGIHVFGAAVQVISSNPLRL